MARRTTSVDPFRTRGSASPIVKFYSFREHRNDRSRAEPISRVSDAFATSLVRPCSAHSGANSKFVWNHPVHVEDGKSRKPDLAKIDPTLG